jgi:hypothetical protein
MSLPYKLLSSIGRKDAEMRSYRRWLAVLPVVGLLLMSGVFARGAAAAQAKSATEVVLAWVDALNAHDAAGLKALSHPEMVLEGEPGTPDAFTVSYDEFFASLHEDAEIELHWEVVKSEETAPDTVVLEVVLTATTIPELPHPYTTFFTFTVKDGLVFHAVAIDSEQTKADLLELAASEEPTGMPTTGAGDSGLLAALLAAGMLSLVVGAGVRRKAARATI